MVENEEVEGGGSRSPIIQSRGWGCSYAGNFMYERKRNARLCV